MTREELMDLLDEVRSTRGELQNVEVKAARRDTPKRLFEPLSAFANRTGGGILLFGVDEERDFEIVGAGDVQKLQSDIGSLASNAMEPVLRLEFSVERIEDKTIVAVEVPEVAAARRPCYYKTAGMQGGSYIRVGNSNRRMTDYEIFGYVSAREQYKFDQEPVQNATMADLDDQRLEDYIARLRRQRPNAPYLRQSVQDVLAQLRIVSKAGDVLRPTLAGLLMFGKYPQGSEPQLVVTFVQYYGTTEAELTPRGERFLDDHKFEGTIPEVVETAVNQVLANMRKSTLIEGLWRRDIPEYPEVAVREAVINAVAHRDYSRYVRGSHVRIRLFADRLEIQSPGGLYGNVTEETLEHEQSTRNPTLIRLMEDLRLVENRGSGIGTMIEAMRAANLEPPRFKDNRSSFLVTFRNHTLLNPAAVAWLNQFAQEPLSDHQRLALVYARVNESISNSDYQRLNRVDANIAYRDLRGMVQLCLLQPHGVGRWTYYTLVPPIESVTSRSPQAAEDRIVAYVREYGSITRAQSMELLQSDALEVRNLLRRMRRRGLLKTEGSRRSARYVLP